MSSSGDIRICAFADVHIHDDVSLRQTVELLERVVKRYRPDLMICLGDSFDTGTLCREYGPRFRSACESMHHNWLFCYGNHDGEAIEGGFQAYDAIFHSSQTSIEINGRRIASFADMADPVEGERFVLGDVVQGSIVCCHGNQPQRIIDALAERGAILILTGHKHFHHEQRSADGKCGQLTLSALRFGGMNGDPAGCAIIDVAGGAVDFKWIESELPAFPMNGRVFESDDAGSGRVDACFEDDPDSWIICPPLRSGDEDWRGGPSLLEHRVKGERRWLKSYGASWVDNCPLSLHEFQGRRYLILGATWLGIDKRMGVKGLESLLVVDAKSGEELYRVPIVGMSAPPTVVDGVIYAVGQWREIFAVELTTGRTLWKGRSQLEGDGFSWHDNRIGGGWSVCPAAVGRHVWTVNSRGDLFGYDRNNGRLLFSHAASIPLNDGSNCVYAPHIGFCARKFRSRRDMNGGLVFEFNGCEVDDASGRILRYSEGIRPVG